MWEGGYFFTEIADILYLVNYIVYYVNIVKKVINLC